MPDTRARLRPRAAPGMGTVTLPPDGLGLNAGFRWTLLLLVPVLYVSC
jgi:hypothetical protein